MPFSRPTFKEIIQRTKSDIEQRLNTGTLIKRSLLAYLAEAFSGASHGLHGHLQYNFRQLFPDTADADVLARWASIWGITRKTAAFATGNVTFTGTNGTEIPQGTVLVRGDRELFSTTSSAIISGGSSTVPVTALSAGELGNTNSGVVLILESAIAGANSNVPVASGGLIGGVDEEKDDLLRARLLERIKTPPHGGSEFDYKTWALEVAGVTRAFVIPQWDGVGTVAVYVLDDDADTAPIPDAQTVLDAQAYIEEQRPVTAQVSVFAPVAKDLDLTIALDPDTATVKAAVEENLKDLLVRKAVPGGKILLSQIREAVSQAAGENDNTVTVPAADFTTATGEIAVLGTITWT